MLAEVPLPSETSPKLLSRLSAQPMSSSLPICGRTRNFHAHHMRNSPTTWPRTTSREASSARKSRNTNFLSVHLLEDLSKNGTLKIFLLFIMQAFSVIKIFMANIHWNNYDFLISGNTHSRKVIEQSGRQSKIIYAQAV